jgi:hypothetical protein
LFSVLGGQVAFGQDNPAVEQEPKTVREFIDKSLKSYSVYPNADSDRPAEILTALRWANNTRGSEDGVTLLYVHGGRPLVCLDVNNATNWRRHYVGRRCSFHKGVLQCVDENQKGLRWLRVMSWSYSESRAAKPYRFSKCNVRESCLRSRREHGPERWPLRCNATEAPCGAFVDVTKKQELTA